MDLPDQNSELLLQSVVFSGRCKQRRLEGRSQLVEQELVRLGEQWVRTSEATRAIASELSHELDDMFLHHIDTGEGACETSQGTSGKVVASFEAILPKRIKGFPLDSMFEMSSIKKVRCVLVHGNLLNSLGHVVMLQNLRSCCLVSVNP